MTMPFDGDEGAKIVDGGGVVANQTAWPLLRRSGVRRQANLAGFQTEGTNGHSVRVRRLKLQTQFIFQTFLASNHEAPLAC